MARGRASKRASRGTTSGTGRKSTAKQSTRQSAAENARRTSHPITNFFSNTRTESATATTVEEDDDSIEVLTVIEAPEPGPSTSRAQPHKPATVKKPAYGKRVRQSIGATHAAKEVKREAIKLRDECGIAQMTKQIGQIMKGEPSEEAITQLLDLLCPLAQNLLYYDLYVVVRRARRLAESAAEDWKTGLAFVVDSLQDPSSKGPIIDFDASDED
ncbi:hypothetical protein WR25_15392 [Diploscapter pachys]|uniref:Uncharacterized protein n=1 Tax=Diploscapter pachys TaxID=2018661 RepID=A0A2A2LJP0_9BILA|nr:hypothetical protein WR25_15392 [Diploscapter pachys]